jgi:hypothetical protein
LRWSDRVFSDSTSTPDTPRRATCADVDGQIYWVIEDGDVRRALRDLADEFEQLSKE